jgi:hypothetical protein
MSGKHSPNRRLELEILEERVVPSTMIASYPGGVWRYDTSAGWSHISNQIPTGPLLADGSGDVYSKFSDGFWRWDATTVSWMKLSTLTADLYQPTDGGVLYASFGNNGVWRWSAGWQQLTALTVGSFAVSNSDAFFGGFSTGVPGTWRWSPTTNWSLLSQAVPDTLRGDDDGVVAVYSGGPGSHVSTWRWSLSAGWSFLPPAPAQSFGISVSADGAIFEDRVAAGIWHAAPGAIALTQISTSNTQSFSRLVALPDGNLFLILDNGPGADPAYSGWFWNASTGWSKISGASDITTIGFDKDSDVFFSRLDPGTWMWSPTGGLHQVSSQSAFGIATQV